MAGLSKLVNTLILAGAVGMSGLAGQTTRSYGQEMAKAETGNEQTQTGKHDHSAKFYESTYSSQNIASLEAELKEHPIHRGFIFLSDLRFQTQDYSGMGSAASSAISMDRNNWEGHHNLATSYCKRNDFPKAWSSIKESLRLSPNNPISYCNAGDILVNWGKYSESEQYYLKALSIDPSNESAKKGIEAATRWIVYLNNKRQYLRR